MPVGIVIAQALLSGHVGEVLGSCLGGHVGEVLGSCLVAMLVRY